MNIKKLLVLSLVSATYLTACGNNQPTGPVEINPNFEVFTSITSLFDYVANEGRVLETETSSYSRTFSEKEKGMFQTKETNIDESGESFANLALTKQGMITVSKYGDDILKDESSTYEFTGLNFLDEKTNVFYEIYDHENGKGHDKASKENYDAANQLVYEEKTSTNTLSTLLSYYKTYLQPNVTQGFDTINPEIDTSTGDVIYRIEDAKKVSYSDIDVLESLSFDITFNKDGIVTSHAFTFREQEVKPTNDGMILYDVFDKYDLTVSERQQFTTANTTLNPLDYFMTSFDVGLIADNGYDEPISVPLNSDFPFDYYLRAEAVNVLPEKALDTNLKVVSSSNQQVVQIKHYQDGTSSARAIGEGTTDITVSSQGGITKTVSVNVVAPAMESIELKTFSKVHYANEATELYIFTNPDNSLDGYKLENLTPDICDIVQDDRGYYSANNKKEGIARIKAYSLKNNNISSILEYRVDVRHTQEETIQAFIGTYKGDMVHSDHLKPDGSLNIIKDAITVQIIDASTATFTFHYGVDQTGHFFIKDHVYTLNYRVNLENKHPDRVEFFFDAIDTVSPSGTHFIYDNIIARLYMNLSNYVFQIASNVTDIYIPPITFEGRK